MKVKVRVCGNSKDHILFEGQLDLLPDCKYAIVIWPQGSKAQHFIWENSYSYPVEIKNLKEDFIYYFNWDD